MLGKVAVMTGGAGASAARLPEGGITREYWTMTGPAAGVMFHNKVALINFNTDL